MYFQCTMLPIYLYFSHVFPMFFSYFITDVLIFGMFAFRLSISVQVSKKMFGKINKRRNPNKHWGGWKKIQSLENLGEVCLALKRILKCKFCLCLVKKKNSLEFFFCIMRKTSLKKLLILLFDYFLQIKVLQPNSQLIN